ncbi:MAG: spermidine/putrescine ABC transporter ATP-binding protein [Rhodospirillaceae bacterium]|nr:spermidine/putrescine ABC transporter ATP-binding protein [Rhodospirillaceae bacterium]
MLDYPSAAVRAPLSAYEAERATLVEKAEPAPLVELAGIRKSYGSVEAVHPLDLTIRKGEFVAILGPSGCGKTTLLRMIGGFAQPSAGTIRIGGLDVTALPPERRPTNLVFQGYGLFPHMTVAQNIGYGLAIRKTPRAEKQRRVEEAMALVRLEGFGDRPIAKLSGGQAQRVALARALVMRPDVLLLDEPLGALDLKLRRAMQEELRRIHRETGGTFVFVTHDQAEAMDLATRICVMARGRVVQDGDPETIYSSPATMFVSTFIGEANLFAGQRCGGVVTLGAGPTIPDPGEDGPVVCVVRPERLWIDAGVEALSECAFRLAGVLESAVFLGPFVNYTVRLDGGESVTVSSREIGLRTRLNAGDRVAVGWSISDHRVLPHEAP